MFCRCRPLGVTEKAVGSVSVMEFEKGPAMEDELIVRTGTNSKKSFKFDRVFSPEDGQGMFLLLHCSSLMCDAF